MKLHDRNLGRSRLDAAFLGLALLLSSGALRGVGAQTVWDVPKQLSTDKYYFGLAANGQTVHFVRGEGTVYYRRSLDEGQTWGAEINLGSGTTYLEDPLICDGPNVYVAYFRDFRTVTDFIGPRPAGNIYMRVSRDNGLTWAPEVKIASSQAAFRLAVTASGSRVHVAWMDYRSLNTWDLYYRRSLDNGAAWQPEVKLVAGTNSMGAERPAMTCIGDALHLAWMDARDNKPPYFLEGSFTIPNATEIYYKRSSDGGGTWGADVRITNHPSDYAGRPAITVAASGTVLVSYDYSINGSSALEEFLLRSADNGGTWQTPLRLSNDNGDSTHSDMDTDSGRAHIVWSDSTSSSSGGVYYRLSPDNGATWAVQEVVASTGGKVAPMIAVTANYIHVTWGGWYYRRSLGPGNTPPAIQSSPWANPNPVTMPNTTTVNVIANDPDNGPAALTYAWSKVSGPGTAGFSPNGTAASASSTASFSLAGSYTLRVTISDGAASVSGDVAVTVNGSGTTVTVDANTKFQTMEGFGGTARVFDDPHMWNNYDPSTGKSLTTLTTAQQDEILDRLYVDLKLTRTRYYTDGGVEPVNDNSDPDATDLTKFNFAWKRCDASVDLAKRSLVRGLQTPYFIGTFETWGSEATTTPAEYVEWSMAVLNRWRQLGVELPYWDVFNEPGLSVAAGGKVVSGAYMRDAMKIMGPKMRAAGFATKFVIPDDVNPQNALSRAQIILADATARSYVGAVATHLYFADYGALDQLKTLAQSYGLPLWMSEYSGPDAFGWAGLMHNLMANYNVSAVDHMMVFFGDWQGDSSNIINLRYDKTTGQYFGYALGKLYYAIGQYSKYVKPGSLRIRADSSDANVQVTAFLNGTDLSIVAINNMDTWNAPRTLSFNLVGLPGVATVQPIRTSNTENWATLAPISVGGSIFTATLPPKSITTFTGTAGTPPPQPPTITSQPASQTVTAGQTATFSVTATGTAPLSYQWRKNGTNVSGATAASYTTPATTLADSGAVFSVVVSNSAGSVTSNGATLTVTASSNLVAYWKLDEGTGTTAADSSGNNHTGTLLNGPAWTSGRSNGALSFNGSNGCVAVADFAPPADLTLEAWIFPTGNPGNDDIILNKHNTEYDFRILNTGVLYGATAGGSVSAAGFNFFDAANLNKWYHVVFTSNKTAGVVKLYRNGVEAASGPTTGAITDTPNALWIGRHSQYNFGTFLGKIDEVRIYNQALSAQEVLNRYSSFMGSSKKRDFSGDGKADILLRNANSGEVYLWLMK